MSRVRARVSRRVVMYVVVAAQLVVLAGIVAPQELNMALDSGPTVELEILRARASKDEFRGAHVSGQTALDLDNRAVVLPAGLRPGDQVLVAFAVEPDRRPRITRVERGRRAAPFTATSFTIPGRVVGDRSRDSVRHERRLLAHVGAPPVRIALDLPDSIAVDESAVARFTGPGLVRASLHAGYLGRRYFTDVRLTGRAWPPDVRFVYDDTRERLVVLAPRDSVGRPLAADAKVRSDLFVFDAAGKELAASELTGRVLDAVVEADGHLLAVVSDDRWGAADVSLVRLAADGRVLQRSAPMAFTHVLGFDATAGGVWALVGPASARPQPPHFIQRTTLAGLREPRLGPFESLPRAVVSTGADVWVVETERHRLTRLDAASGRTVREYRDLNGPVDVAVDGESIYVIEASRTQLTRLAQDGSVLWRVPRFQGLTWAVPEPGVGGGWVGAAMFEGAPAGVLRVGPDGRVTRVAAATRPVQRGDWPRRLGSGVIRSARDGRLLFLEPEAIVILSADGTTVTRVVGFRFPDGPRLRS